MSDGSSGAGTVEVGGWDGVGQRGGVGRDRHEAVWCAVGVPRSRFHTHPPLESPRVRADPRPRVLFLCTGNSCRSQMAEGWARAIQSAAFEAYSAGTDPKGLNPLAVRAMAEVGIDISGHTSKRPEDIGLEFDLVVTVCDAASESCPAFPSATRVIHAAFDDPPRLAGDAATPDEAMFHYRRVRDEIRRLIETLPAAWSGCR
ncbi:MAG: arsenate reductase ArsC [Phycisphaeraceae bacterium]|nr:MAG: arsenate reductase ArsC [Phycisphaeraceae bacterium]